MHILISESTFCELVLLSDCLVGKGPGKSLRSNLSFLLSFLLS